MQSYKIMIVEDEEIVAADIQTSIEKMGYAVCAMASSGREAIKKADSSRPDLILMDIILKGSMDGIEAATRIKELYMIPVIYLTAFGDDSILQRAKVAEPYGYITKPFNQRELQIAIEISIYKKQAEDRIHKMEFWLATVLKSIGDAVIASDKEHRITFMNTVAERLTGWNQEEALGKNLTEVLNIKDRDLRDLEKYLVEKVITEGLIINLIEDRLLIAKDGSELPISDSAAPIKNDNNESPGSVIVFRDITKNKQLEENLRTHQVELEMQNAELLRRQKELDIARARYFDLYDLAPVGYCTVSEKGLVLEANLTVATLLGLPRGALIKQRFSKFILPEDNSICYLNHKRLLATGEPQACELRIVRKDGTVFWGHLSMTSAKDADGTPVCRVVLSDISDLKQTNELFSLFMRHSPIYTYFKEVTSTQSIVLQASDNFAQMIGIPSTAMIGKTMTELFSPEFAAKITAEDWAVVSGGEVLRLEEELNGRIFDTIKFPIVRGEKTLLAGYTVDITERKQAEEAIRQSRERAKRLAAEMAVIAEIGRVAGSTLDVNQVFERVDAEVHKLIPHDRLLVNLKRDKNEFVVAYLSGTDNPRRRMGDLYPSQGSATGVVMNTRAGILIQPDDAEEIKDLYPNLYATFKTGLRSTMSVPLISMGEVIGSMNFRSEKLKAYTEHDLSLAERIGMQIAGAIANAQMFNDLSKTEKTLRESEEKYRILFEGLNDAVFVHDLDEEGLTGRFLQVNDVACRRMGYTREELLSLTPRDITQPEEYERIADKRIGLDSRGDILVETIHVTKDGMKIPVESNIRKFLYLGRQVALSISRDITDRKRAEEEQQSLSERLQRAEKMEALGLLAGGVAHDLNNVLGILSGYSELLLEEIPQESRSRGHVQKILQSTQKGAAIIQDLLTLARRGVTASEVLNLNSVVSDFLGTPVFDKFKEYYPRVTFRTECDNNLLNIKGSPIHLEKTVMNLVSNAAEAITETGEVTIRTENRHLEKPIQGYDEVSEGDYAVLTVSDTGMGIPAESIGKIFEPFYTKKKMGRSGTGLGLAIVWGTVKDHNGYIDVQTEVGKGTTFTLYFPVTREELTSPEAEIPIEQYMGQGESVLVVDDIAEQREVATTLLMQLGYSVKAVSSGEAAVEYLKSNKADILVLDMIMEPGIDGLDTYKLVLEINPLQKAIIVSGFSETDRTEEAQRLGAGAYVKKPYLKEKIGLAICDELARK